MHIRLMPYYMRRRPNLGMTARRRRIAREQLPAEMMNPPMSPANIENKPGPVSPSRINKMPEMVSPVNKQPEAVSPAETGRKPYGYRGRR